MGGEGEFSLLTGNFPSKELLENEKMGEGRRRLEKSRERTANEEEGEGEGGYCRESIRWKGERER